MVDINLLPWRKLQQSYQKTALKKIFGSVISLVMGTVAVFYIFNACQIDEVSQHVSDLTQQVTQFSKQRDSIENIDQTARLGEIQSKDVATKSLFILLGKANDNAVCFTSISRHQNKISFVGRTRSPVDLTQFLRSWQAVSLFSEVQIARLERDVKPNMFFHFYATLPSVS